MNRQVTIIVSGIGGMFYHELRLIEDALKKEGFNVTLTDRHEDHFKELRGGKMFSLDEEREITKSQLAQDSKSTMDDITLVADHKPWSS